MRTIWKYTIKNVGETVLAMPQGAQVLTAALQGEGLHIWAIVSPEVPTEQRFFYVSGTGWELPEDKARRFHFISTVQQSGGRFIWHVFENLSV